MIPIVTVITVALSLAVDRPAVPIVDVLVKFCGGAAVGRLVEVKDCVGPSVAAMAGTLTPCLMSRLLPG